MKNNLILITVVLSIFSCEKKNTEKIETGDSADSISVAETAAPVESSTLQNCYIQVTGKDSVFISLDDNLGTITGKMRYKNFEKDNSTGDIMGTKSGDTLKLNYTFQSEGSTSDREIYFLKKGDQLLEGIGEHSTEGSKEIYSNYAKIKFEQGNFKQTDCKDFEKYFSGKK